VPGRSCDRARGREPEAGGRPRRPPNGQPTSAHRLCMHHEIHMRINPPNAAKPNLNRSGGLGDSFQGFYRVGFRVSRNAQALSESLF